MISMDEFEAALAESIAGQIKALGARAKELDWYAGNLFPEDES